MKNKMTKTLGMLARVKGYMDAFGVEYLMINSDLVANNNENGLVIYDPKDTRKVARVHETLVYWDNHRNNKVSLYENVMNVTK